ncbi:hypothetical protein LPJ56_004292 [Coemansia sp. RSA 2599]|nr:hypothetical protein LPJ75_004109 [Coemansia sp. RSA 2598]KAJ1816461.1 hypothetical protein LPJ56_004292 [Coemansia sp. RSA 2599]
MPASLLRTAYHRATAVSARRMYTTKPDVSFQELRQLIHGVKHTPYTLIDVREPHEVAEGKVPTATNIPLGDVAAAFSLPADDFKAKYGIDKPTTSQETIFYCRSGKRSQNAIDQVEKISPELVIRNYRGSWLNYLENALDNKSLV